MVVIQCHRHLPPQPRTVTPTSFVKDVIPQSEEYSLSSALNEISRVKPLNGPDDWPGWERKLMSHMSILDLWETLTGEKLEPNGSQEREIWKKRQRQLRGLLIIICRPSAHSIIKPETSMNVIQYFKLLKAAYGAPTFSTLTNLMRIISKCSLSNHISIRDYSKEVFRARDQLAEMGHPILETLTMISFLNGLGESYSTWKDMYLNGYAKSSVGSNGRFLVPSLEEVTAVLVDQDSSNAAAAAQISPKESSTKPEQDSLGHKGKIEPCKTCEMDKDQGQFKNKAGHDNCKHCGHRHKSEVSWHMNPDQAPEYCIAKLSTAESRKATLEKNLKHKGSTLKSASKASENTIQETDGAMIGPTNSSKDNSWYLTTDRTTDRTTD